MKNGSIVDKLRMQEQEINTKLQQQISTSVDQPTSQLISHSNETDGVSSLFSILPSGTDSGYTDEQQPKPKKRKKKRRPRLS